MSETTKEEKEENVRPMTSMKEILTCPDCGGLLLPSCGCWFCRKCGWSKCYQNLIWEEKMLTNLINKNKAMTTLDKVSERVDGLSQDCTDQLVKVKDISFNHLESVNIGSETHPIRSVAQQSIAYRLAIPIQYLRRCPEELQKRNMNYWIEHEKNEELYFRFDGNEVRALFTPRYKPVDNFEIMERLDSLGFGPGTPVQCHLDPEFMVLNIPDGEKIFKINGDTMSPGISISNSEVGLASLGIAAYILRLVCTNGLINTTEVSTKFRHVSTKILGELPEVLNSVSSELTLQKDQLRLSIESPVPNPEFTFDEFNKRFMLGEPEREAMKWAWPQETKEGNNMFSIINTYTRAAQFEGLPAELSYKLQKIGGDILSMVH